MKAVKSILDLIKKYFDTFKELTKGKSPKEILDNIKAVAAALGVAGLTIYGLFNRIRVYLKRRQAAKEREEVRAAREAERYDAHDYIQDVAENYDIMDQVMNPEKEIIDLDELKRQKREKEANGDLTEQELAALREIAKKRNALFRTLDPVDQVDVLETEGFDFKKYARNYKPKKKRRHPFAWHKTLCNLGVTPEDAAFRERVDYGFFGFILNPLDDFIHWLRNDPVPKKVKQIKFFDKRDLPDFECETAVEFVDFCQGLNHWRFGGNNKEPVTDQSLELMKIKAEEAFKHKTRKKYMKAMRERLKMSKFNQSLFYDYMDDDKGKKKDKDKKKKKKDKKKDFDLYGKSEKKKDKKKKDKNKDKKKDKGKKAKFTKDGGYRRRQPSKEELKDQARAEKHAQKLLKHYQDQYASGEIVGIKPMW